MLFKILIVDNGSSLFLLNHGSTIWKECGFEISGHTSDVNDAIRAMMKKDFDLLLCINRPSSQIATELLCRISQKSKNIPVIVIGQFDDSHVMRECFLLGAIDYLVEPVKENDMRDTLHRVVEILNNVEIETEYFKALDVAVEELPQTNESAAFIEKLRIFMTESKDKAVTTETAASFFGFNKDYFGRYFKNKMGMTFSEFYKIFTMEYAKSLLLSGHFKVHDVSRLLGFSSSDYFTRVFKKTTGKTPSEFRTM